MAKRDKAKMHTPPDRERPEKKAEPAAEMADTWIDERLRALYQAVVEEPLPDDMISKLNTKRRSH